MNTRSPAHDFVNPSSSFVKYFGHFALYSSAQGSSVKLNSELSRSKKACGVAQLSVLDEKCTSRLFPLIFVSHRLSHEVSIDCYRLHFVQSSFYLRNFYG